MTPGHGKRSLWLVPEKAETAALQRLIDTLATRCGGPCFPPHVTLCSGIAEGSNADLSLSQLPLAAELGGVQFGQEFFHACYLPVEPSEELRKLQERCADAWQGKLPAHPPHSSLFYGALGPEQQELARNVAQAAPAQLTLVRCELWQTGGPVESWRQLA